MVSIATKIILVLFIIIPQFIKSGDSSLVKQVVSNIVKSVPDLEKEIESSPKTEVVKVIISSGFQTFSQSADITQYTGVKDDHIFPFLFHLKKMTNLPEKYQRYFLENLSMVLYSDFNELIVFNIMYDITSGGDCKYICIIANRDADSGTTDFLVGDIKSSFTLANQIMVVNETKVGLFGLLNLSKSKIIETSPNITNEQISTLFKYFTICIFKRFGELMNINTNLALDSNGFLQ
jgi:hypothetical protein